MNNHAITTQQFHMNHVNLIGKMTSDPRIAVLPGGKKVAQFSLSTNESYLDEDGNVCVRQNWHRMTAWGRWVSVLEELCTKGVSLAIEGKLVSRFYRLENGKRQMISEIEVNDLIIL
ncbi:MAG: single-stranded DNA-binding protein [Bacteroidota bacterium]